MPTHPKKITTRQLFIMLILVTLSPSIRLFPQICSEYGGYAGWLAAVPAAAFFFVLLVILSALFKNNSSAGLSEVFELSLGKAAAKLLLVFYMLWLCIEYFLYIRYYADRLLSSIYPNTNIHFFILIIFIPVLIALRGRIESFARFCEFSILMFTIVFVIFYIMMAPAVQPKHLLPVTTYDIWPVLKSSYAISGIWCYIIFLFFLGDFVIKKESVMNIGKKAMLYLLIMTTLMMICVVGSVGPKLAERMPLPFFGAVKLVSIMHSFDRLEAVLLSIWVVSDFIVITTFGLLIMNIVKKIFNVTQHKYFAVPVAMLGYAGSIFIATNKFQLEVFSANIALPMNIIMCFFVPALVLAIGKLRKRL